MARGIKLWLGCLYLLIAAIVAVGGITRLTGSGLSIVDWQPLMGAIPPLNEAQWLEVFERYQQSPQFRTVNHWMTLSDFQSIFFWEYLHRLFARALGVVFLIPWLWFLVRRKFDRRQARASAVIFGLGALQGAVGWYMVRSGLVDIPAVSPYRLAVHLLLAFLLANYVLWLACGMPRWRRDPAAGAQFRSLAQLLVVLVVVQVFYGALTAGTRAGYVYQTFPRLNGEWIPSGAWALVPAWRNLFENQLTLHFMHRTLGYICALIAVLVTASALARARTRSERVIAALPAVTALLQVTLGILTVIGSVPITLAVLHQVVALLLVSAALLVSWRWPAAAAAPTIQGALALR